jgi:hypothetical protein
VDGSLGVRAPISIVRRDSARPDHSTPSVRRVAGSFTRAL